MLLFKRRIKSGKCPNTVYLHFQQCILFFFFFLITNMYNISKKLMFSRHKKNLSLSSMNVTFSVFFTQLARTSLTLAPGQGTILTAEPWIGWTNI